MSTIWTHLGGLQHSIEFVDVGDVRTRVLRSGGGGTTCVLLHGSGGHLEVFARNIAALSEFHRVVAIDLFGHGFTSNTGGEAQNWESLANHVLNTLDRLGIDESIWIGEALGAQLVEWVALTAPERLAGGVLINAVIPDAQPELPPSDEVLRFQSLSAAALADPTDFELMRERIEWLLAPTTPVPTEMVELRMKMWQRPGFREAHTEMLAFLRQAREVRSFEESALSAIQTPLLVCWGAHNRLMPAAAGAAFARAVPSGDFLLFTNSGMWPQYEEWQVFNREVGRWLTTGRSTGRSSQEG